MGVEIGQLLWKTVWQYLPACDSATKEMSKTVTKRYCDRFKSMATVFTTSSHPKVESISPPLEFGLTMWQVRQCMPVRVPESRPQDVL